MKKFYVFVYNDYESRGGLKDVAGIFETQEDALAFCKDGEAGLTGFWDTVEIECVFGDGIFRPVGKVRMKHRAGGIIDRTFSERMDWVDIK